MLAGGSEVSQYNLLISCDFCAYGQIGVLESMKYTLAFCRK